MVTLKLSELSVGEDSPGIRFLGEILVLNWVLMTFGAMVGFKQNVFRSHGEKPQFYFSA